MKQHRTAPAGRVGPLPTELVAVLLDNRSAPTRREADRSDRWRIKKIGGIWVAWPIAAGVFVHLRPVRRHWLTSSNHTTLLADVTRRIYAK